MSGLGAWTPFECMRKMRLEAHQNQSSTSFIQIQFAHLNPLRQTHLISNYHYIRMAFCQRNFISSLDDAVNWLDRSGLVEAIRFSSVRDWHWVVLFFACCCRITDFGIPKKHVRSRAPMECKFPVLLWAVFAKWSKSWSQISQSPFRICWQHYWHISDMLPEASL